MLVLWGASLVGGSLRGEDTETKGLQRLHEYDEDFLAGLLSVRATGHFHALMHKQPWLVHGFPLNAEAASKPSQEENYYR